MAEIQETKLKIMKVTFTRKILLLLCVFVCCFQGNSVYALAPVKSDAGNPIKPDQPNNLGYNTENTVHFSIDSRQTGKRFTPIWTYFGYDECNATTSEDGKALLRELANICQRPPHIRTHFLLCSGDGAYDLKWGATNVYTEDRMGNPVYDWKILDEIVDTVVQAGCRHHFQFGFMPAALAPPDKPYKNTGLKKHGKNTGVSSPPVDYHKWATVIKTVTDRYVKRYPEAASTWNWETWNEPNIGFFGGSFEEFCTLNDFSARAFRDVLPGGRYGGPHTAGGGWLTEFMEHCANGVNYATGRKGTPLEFIAFHSKGTTNMVNGHPQMQLQKNLRVCDEALAAIASNKTYRRTPVIIGEYDPEGTAALSAKVKPANAYRNESIYAAYEVALMKHTLDLAKSHNINLEGALTWAFMFENKAYFEGFRALTTNGIKKPVFNAFVMLGMLRGNRIDLNSSGALGLQNILKTGVRNEADIDGMAFRSEGKTQAILWHYHDDMAEAPGRSISLSVTAPSNSVQQARVTHYRIDRHHSNAHTRWLEMGSPQKLSTEQKRVLKLHGSLELLSPVIVKTVRQNTLTMDFELPRSAVSLLEVEWMK
jgi:xylan 1,4-beta-xylosidase